MRLVKPGRRRVGTYAQWRRSPPAWMRADVVDVPPGSRYCARRHRSCGAGPATMARLVRTRGGAPLVADDADDSSGSRLFRHRCMRLIAQYFGSFRLISMASRRGVAEWIAECDAWSAVVTVRDAGRSSNAAPSSVVGRVDDLLLGCAEGARRSRLPGRCPMLAQRRSWHSRGQVHHRNTLGPRDRAPSHRAAALDHERRFASGGRSGRVPTRGHHDAGRVPTHRRMARHGAVRASVDRRSVTAADAPRDRERPCRDTQAHGVDAAPSSTRPVQDHFGIRRPSGTSSADSS